MDLYVVNKAIEKTFILPVEETNTVMEVKQKIQTEVSQEDGGGVACDQQLLTLENGIQLLDVRPLTHYALENGSTIYFFIGNPKIHDEEEKEEQEPLVLGVWLNRRGYGEELKFQMESDDLVVDLMQKVEQETGISLQDQQLFALLENRMPESDLRGRFDQLYLFNKKSLHSTTTHQAATIQRQQQYGNDKFHFFLFLLLLLNVVVLLYAVSTPEQIRVALGGIPPHHWPRY